MPSKEKKGIIILVGVVLIVLLLVILVAKGSGDKTKEVKGNVVTPTMQNNTEKYTTSIGNETKINTSNELNKMKKYNNIEISNIQFTYEEGRSVLLADAKNTSSTKHNIEIVKITILDENNQVIDVLTPTIPDLKPGETKQLNIIITGKDCVNAKDFKIEAK